MRNCPTCRSPLTPVDYEGFRILQCGQCRGHLAGLAELGSIKAVAARTRDELKAEAVAGYRGSTLGRVKCPRCHMEMERQARRLPGLVLCLDICRPCALVWLDGGELALAQLGHEAGAGFQDAQTMKRRMADLEADPERRASFEAKLAALPEEQPGLLADVAEAALEPIGTNSQPGDLTDVLDVILRKGVFR